VTTYDRSRTDSDPKVRCDACSPFDADGFTLNLSGDTGTRVWDRRWSMDPVPCPGCGHDANRPVVWGRP
jgi:hypothetical protein